MTRTHAARILRRMETEVASIPYLAVLCGVSAANLYDLAQKAPDWPDPVGSWGSVLTYDVHDFAKWWRTRDASHEVDFRALSRFTDAEFERAEEALASKRRKNGV